ncbi:MAG TPA: hypothetical protein ENK13_01885 [Thermopetrobacter sp.]|nr:hypothetical protein [Thermopetrobacter sp.]
MGSLTDEDVRQAFRHILGREPESPDVIRHYRNIEDFERLREVLLNSREFSLKYEAMKAGDAETFARWAVRVLLAREPQGKEEIAALLEHGTAQRIREALIDGDEFRFKLTAFRRTMAARPREFERTRRIFMHVPKTGGTTLHAVFSRHFPPARTCPERWNGLYGYTLEELLRYEYYSGHFDYYACLMIPARRRRIVTILRNPVDRLLSLYHFQRAHREEIIERDRLDLARLANRYDLEDFFRADEVRRHPSIDNTYVRTLTGRIPRGRWEHTVAADGEEDEEIGPLTEEAFGEARANLRALDACGILEDFDASLPHMLAGLGLDAEVETETVEKKMVLDTIVHENPGLRPIPRQEVTPGVLKAMEDLVAMDMELYEFARELMRERTAREEEAGTASQ